MQIQWMRQDIKNCEKCLNGATMMTAPMGVIICNIIRFTANIAPKSFDLVQHTIRNTVKL